LNISILQRRIQKLDHEIDTSLAEKKKTRERERKLESEALERARIKREQKRNRGYE
jgi:hypothetical protein